MQDATLEAIKAILKLDPTVTPSGRAEILAAIRNRGRNDDDPPRCEQPSQILRRSEVALRLAVSPRSVDRLAGTGVLRKLTLPGRRRARGFRAADVESLIRSL